MNALTKETLDSVNKIEDERIINFLDKVVNDIYDKKIQVTNYTKIILTMLVSQLILYYKASDTVFVNGKVSSKDVYERNAKAPEIAVLQKCHDQILNLLDKITLSPMSSAKVKKLNQSEDQSSEELYNELLND